MRSEVDEHRELQWPVAGAEAQPVWDLLTRIFRITQTNSTKTFDGDPPFFVNPNWIVVGLVNDLESLAYPPGGPEEIRDGVITWEEWETLSNVLEPEDYFERGGFYERDELGPFLDMMIEEGARVLYFTHPNFQNADSIQAGTATREGLKAAAAALRRSDCCYEVYGNFVFDNTGRWGLYTVEDGVAFLAAEVNLMERYLPEVGGLGVLQERFASHTREGADPDDALYRVQTARTYRSWYTYMGWDWPFPEPPI